MKRALVTIVTANLEEMCVFSQEVLPIEPQVSRGNCVELPLEARLLALWRQSECAAFGGITSTQGTTNHRVLMKFAVEDEAIEGESARLKGREIEWGQELTRQP